VRPITAHLVRILRDGDPLVITDVDKRLFANLPAYLDELEENLTDRLPDGYEARITEWSSDE
jgi:hypothetical protein